MILVKLRSLALSFISISSMLIRKTFATGCAACGVTAKKRNDIYERIIPNISIK